MTQHSSVSAHLKIPVAEYDARIRTFVPYYEEMLDVAGSCFDRIAGDRPAIVDLGTGTGALTERLLRHRPEATCVGIDMDAEVLAMARRRLGEHRVDLRLGSYLDLPLPACDVIAASISLHHVRTAAAKRALYQGCRQAVRPGGAMIIADCFLPRLAAGARAGLASWQRFLEQHYAAEESRAFLDAWADEDTYFPLMEELGWLEDAGFEPDVVWRRDLFCVIVAI
jgi:SAM-dependent methyltransferase